MNVTSLFSALSGLSGVKRYSMSKLLQQESVLEHTAMVAFIAMVLGREINAIGFDGVVIDLEELLTKSLMHDVDELMTGDVPRPTKYRNDRTLKMFRDLAAWGVDVTVKSLEVTIAVENALIESHRLAKSNEEGLIVAIADNMCVALKVWEELLVRGNRSMASHAGSLLGALDELHDEVVDRFGHISPVTGFLQDVIDQCAAMMTEAAANDRGLGPRELRR